MAKLSPAFKEGTSPREPTRAAAPSLHDFFVSDECALRYQKRNSLRDDISVKVRCNGNVKDPIDQDDI